MSYGRIERGPMGAQVVGSNFTQVYNDAVRDKKLSWKARGLLTWILSHEEGFGISVASIVAAAPDGAKAVYSGLKELEDHRYLKRRQEKDPETKQWTAMVYRVTDIPNGATIHIPSPWEEENPSSGPLRPNGDAADETNGHSGAEPDRQNRHAGKGHAGKAPHKKTTFEEDHVVRSASASLSKKRAGTPADEEAPSAERDAAAPSKTSGSSKPSAAGGPRSPRGASPRTAPAGPEPEGGSSPERSLPSEGDTPGGGAVQKTGAKPSSSSADRRAAAWRAARAWVEVRESKGAVVPPAAPAAVERNALRALKEHDEEVVVAACRDMALRDGRFKDPLRHLEHFSPGGSRGGALAGGDRKLCKDHKCRRCLGTGFVESEPYPGKIPPRCYGEDSP